MKKHQAKPKSNQKAKQAARKKVVARRGPKQYPNPPRQHSPEVMKMIQDLQSKAKASNANTPDELLAILNKVSPESVSNTVDVEEVDDRDEENLASALLDIPSVPEDVDTKNT